MTKPKIKVAYLLGLASWLNELQLDGRKNRERVRAVKMLADKFKEIEKFRLELVDKYAQKDEEGKNKMTEDGQSILLIDDQKEKFVEELNDLYNEEFEMDIDDTQCGILKDIILNTDYVFGPKDSDTEQEKTAKVRQSNDYVYWCEAFEKCE